ncbi:unnamed protein product [Linum tenue]|uniref:Uncharacterized protein n=1 Tax=Linum tenue TaxID=586396 RepID=A0AAV0QX71_9ROSI|nr:unnamed protein product [Linum tenue]
MDWWDKVIFPVRRVWVAVSARVKSRKHGSGGILMLHNDVQTCGYEDVQVMWEMLRRSQLEIINGGRSSNGNLLKQHRPFWRSFVWSNARRNRRTSGSTSPLVADIA